MDTKTFNGDLTIPGDSSDLPSGYRRSARGGIEFALHLRWGDMDINHHINNVQFARLFEEARVRAFHAWIGRARRMPVLVVRQDIEFRAPLDYTIEPITAEVLVSRIGGSSFTLGATLTDTAGKLSAVASTTLVAVDPDTGTPAPLPEEVREILSDWRGERPRFHGED